MTTGEFVIRDWIERLAWALRQLDRVQAHYMDELVRHSPENARSESEYPSGSAKLAPWHALCLFYGSARFQGGDHYEQYYRRLRIALAEVRAILGTHPAWARVVDPSDEGSEFWIQTPSHGRLRTFESIIGGLMVRALEVSGDGFRVASSELSAMLAPDEERETAGALPDLNMGYHVALFYGLRISGEMQIADEMKIVPFKQLGEFVNDSVLQEVAPDIVRYNGKESVVAIVKPYRWKPEFYAGGGCQVSEADWGGSFFEDAEVFVELLAVSHAAPAICLVTIPYCIHRTACCLLGEARCYSSYNRARSPQLFSTIPMSNEVSKDAFDEARGAFLDRRSGHYQAYAPVISRLSEALVRSGRFGVEDKILDVAISLEQMYELDGNEISYKLKMRAACLLRHDTQNRMRVFEDMDKFYRARSRIVHKRHGKTSAEERIDAFKTGFELARESVFKLLQEGAPTDWNELVIAGTESRP